MKDSTGVREADRPRGDTLAARLALVLAVFILVATSAVTVFEYARGRRQILARAETRLAARDRLVADRLRRALGERRRLVGVWPELEAAQDLAVDDIDKRLSSALVRLARSFETPDLALGTDPTGRVLAASALPWLGQDAAGRPWMAPFIGDSVTVLRSQDPELGPVLRTAIRVRARSDGRPLGAIILLTPWDTLLARVAGSDRGALVVRSDDGTPLFRGGLADRADSARLLWSPTVPVRIGARTVGLQLTDPLDAVLAPLRTTRRQFLALALVVLAVTLPAAVILARSATQPLRRLTAAAARIARQEEAEFTVPPGAPREVRVLAGALEAMVDRLERSRRELARQESLAAMGTMAAVLAHEIRTPLSVLRGSADILASRVDDEAATELVSFIGEEIDRLGRLVNDLLVFARPRPPQLEPIDLGDVAERAARAIRDRLADADLRLERDARPAPVDADPEQLFQVALNLLTNAGEATPAGGTIRIATDAEAGRSSLTVEDTGRGIPADELERIWTPFFSTRKSGTGLGLAIVRRVVEAHDGRVAAESRPGRTRITITLPRRTAGEDARSEGGPA